MSDHGGPGDRTKGRKANDGNKKGMLCEMTQNPFFLVRMDHAIYAREASLTINSSIHAGSVG